MIDTKNDSEDYLIHYGVLGMKWGVRKKKSSRRKTTSKKMSPKVKKQLAKNIIKVGAASTVLGLATGLVFGGVYVGSYKLAKMTARAISTGRQYTDKILENSNAKQYKDIRKVAKTAMGYSRNIRRGMTYR